MSSHVSPKRNQQNLRILSSGTLSVPFERRAAEEMADMLFADFWQWRLKDSPELATMMGEHKYDHLLESYTLDSYDKRRHVVEEFLKRGRELLPKVKDKWSLCSLHIFIDALEGYLRGLDNKAHLYPISFLEGVHVDLLQTVDYMVFNTPHDYRKLVSRYSKVPEQADGIIELMREGIRQKRTMHAASMKSVVERFEALQGPAEKSSFYAPFLKFPDSIPQPVRDELQKQGRDVIEKELLPAFQKLGSFMKEEYMKNLRPDIAASSLPGGKEYYAACLLYHLGTPLNAEQVHQMGLAEVSRISDSIQQIVQELGLKMSNKEFMEMLRKDKPFNHNSGEDILKDYDRLLNEVINPKLTTIFKNLPKSVSKLRLQLMDASRGGGPAAMYIQGTPDFSRPGIFYINGVDVARSPKYIIPALALHEGNPGHHLQGSYALELPGMPAFRSQLDDRRYNDGPAHFPMHTAFIEGWALYSEYLGHELGVYKDAYERFGHLSQETLRACRLVVDTGMHALGWSREKAINFLLEHIASNMAEVESEIDRYITWPGQACAYKVGELKIQELRQKAQNSLGNKFDIRDFHQVLMANPGPLTFVEKEVDEYIQAALQK
ncbi:uncharacterized protein LOC135368720 isoform X2 [Ornithodoros turicata]|uniref:uncharacterized protein LOC135368720 isoform X2 n=1 Tax=Ornithodoros turicata TaxID=34597 RepID=UPI0031395E06